MFGLGLGAVGGAGEELSAAWPVAAGCECECECGCGCGCVRASMAASVSRGRMWMLLEPVLVPVVGHL